MADHAQQQILEAIRDSLIAAAIVPAGHVHLDRIDPFDAGRDLPAINVLESSDGEQLEQQSVDGGLDQRVLAIVVQAAVAQTTDYAAQARELGKRVELALWPAVINKRKRCRLVSSRIVLDGSGQTPIAMREQTWRIRYFTRTAAPDVPI